MPVMAGSTGTYFNAGAPVGGTDEVQTTTIGGSPNGAFKYLFGGFKTGAITWSATNATLLANIQAALNALPNVGTNGIVATAGTIVAGIGTVLLTFSGANLSKRAQPTITVVENNTGGTVSNAETTPGVDATALGAAKGARLVDSVNAKLYINTGTAAAPTWTVVGTQVP